MSLLNNTTNLQSLLEQVNALPEAGGGGVSLPTLSNEASTSELFSGKQLIGSDGNIKTGTFTIDSEITEQQDLISQIASALEGKVAGGAVDDSTLVSLLSGDITEFNNENITRIKSYAFYDCYDLHTINLPNAMDVGESAFSECGVINVRLDSIEDIWGFAFAYCYTLEYIYMPNVCSIGYGAFEGCENLNNIHLSNIETIQDTAFAYCSSLDTVVISSPFVFENVGYGIFEETPISYGEGYIYVPSALIEDYISCDAWSEYATQFRAIEDYPDICGGDE